MPVTPEETLKRLANATEEAKTTMRELHAARASALDVVKRQRQHLQELLQAEVKAAVGELHDGAYDVMVSSAEAVIKRLERDWRVKLGLDPEREN